MKVNLSEMTLKEVRAAGKIQLAVLPWGSCECHNLHLPYGCDTLTVSSLAEKAALLAAKKGARVVVLPAMPVGVNSDLFGFPLVLHFSPTTQLAILRDIVWSLENHRVYKLLLLNGHGGNNFRALIKELYGQTRVHIFLCDWWQLVEKLVKKVCSDPGGEHGNEAESSWMMYLHPELVHLKWADAGQVRKARLKSLRKGSIWTPRPWHVLTTNSGHGNPRLASAEKGRQIVEYAVAEIGEIVREIANVRLDRNFPY